MSSRITSNSVQNAELLALLHGLRLAISNNFRVTSPEAELRLEVWGFYINLFGGLQVNIHIFLKFSNTNIGSTKKLVGLSEPMNPHLAPPLTTIATDSKEVIRLLHNQNSSESNVLIECRELIQRLRGTTILDEFREGNIVVDLLARKVRDLQNALRFEIWNKAPIFVVDDVKEHKKNSTLVNQGPNLCNMLPIMSTIQHVISSDASSNADTSVVMMLT
ncbi:hypothetical protein MTR67_026671 [Solanum verrucosum]|uniref:Uncharacterized protein n=1 Tax=Solanum verrucosum TaxID=315347 RepID=A0AAF0R0Z1_SOLVR|nr:hypothetical protein MTR67_026671 [Solanum verrucosum]